MYSEIKLDFSGVNLKKACLPGKEIGHSVVKLNVSHVYRPAPVVYLTQFQL